METPNINPGDIAELVARLLEDEKTVREIIEKSKF
jgi:hypothetical protein